MAVPSERITPLLFVSRTKGFEYWALLCKQGGNASEFELMCRGGQIAQLAVETVKTAAQEGRAKDAMRSEVASRILKAISMYFLSNFEINLTDCRRNTSYQSRSTQGSSTQAGWIDSSNAGSKITLASSIGLDKQGGGGY
jgi:hypothetical protein